MAVICTTPTLWMGDLESDWDEEFITKGFQNMGITIRSLKIIKNKVTGLPAGYCFVDFTDKDKAQEALLKLNGKVIPGTTPVRRFKLNSAGYGKDSAPLPEYSLFVGELSDDVDDYVLYQAFAKRYRSCRSVKIVTDSSGRSKGYGFIRFTEENDQQRALIEMQHFPGISRRPIRVSLATPKRWVFFLLLENYTNENRKCKQYQGHIRDIPKNSCSLRTGSMEVTLPLMDPSERYKGYGPNSSPGPKGQSGRLSNIHKRSEISKKPLFTVPKIKRRRPMQKNTVTVFSCHNHGMTFWSSCYIATKAYSFAYYAYFFVNQAINSYSSFKIIKEWQNLGKMKALHGDVRLDGYKIYNHETQRAHYASRIESVPPIMKLEAIYPLIRARNHICEVK
ncbi:Hypothetical predicted protein, partial [Mytilus galloprovincialis]